jgi:hypothetical protein
VIYSKQYQVWHGAVLLAAIFCCSAYAAQCSVDTQPRGQWTAFHDSSQQLPGGFVASEGNFSANDKVKVLED